METIIGQFLAVSRHLHDKKGAGFYQSFQHLATPLRAKAFGRRGGLLGCVQTLTPRGSAPLRANPPGHGSIVRSMSSTNWYDLVMPTPEARPLDASYLFRATLLDRLCSGHWPAGTRLPTERAFSEQYRISRTTVRKVLAEFKAQGLIAQTVGSGTYVTDAAIGLGAGSPARSSDREAPPLAPAATASASETPAALQAALQTSPAELMQARLALEPAIVEMVIVNATPADFEQLERCCARAEAATSAEEFEVWDGLFHEVIARAAHNGFVAQLFKLMNMARAQGEWGMLKKRSLTPERRLAYQTEHRALLQAIKDRDPERARARAVEHLLHVRRNLLDY